MTSARPGHDELDPELVAAIVAAVQAYLDEESPQAAPQADTRPSVWRMAARQLGLSRSWKGRD